MIVRIEHAKDGWGDYVRNGTKAKKRDPNLIEEIGNTRYGDELCRGGYYRVVLAFRGKMDNKQVKKILKEWVDIFMHGYEEDEYYYDAVIHQDTDDSHVHIRFYDYNLLTGTKLKFYNHRTDLKRKQLIQDTLDGKYGLAKPKNHQQLIKESKQEYYNDWREEFGRQGTVSFETKKERDQWRDDVSNFLLKMTQEGLIESLDDIRRLFSPEGELDGFNTTTIVNEGFDRKKQSYYITVQDDEGDKIRLFGDYFNDEFWKMGADKRAYQAENNHSLVNTKIDRSLNLEDALNKENIKREKFLQQRYGGARKRERAKNAEAKKRAEALKKDNSIDKVKEQLQQGEKININAPVLEDWQEFLLVYQAEQNRKIRERDEKEARELQKQYEREERQRKYREKIATDKKSKVVSELPFEPVPEPQKEDDIDTPVPIKEISGGDVEIVDVEEKTVEVKKVTDKDIETK